MTEKKEAKCESCPEKSVCSEKQGLGNIIFVGKKPTMNYVLSTLTILTTFGEARIKARGRAISKAVDVSQIVKNKFLKDAKIEKVNITTEEKETEQGAKNFSVIEIVMKK